MKKNIHFVQAVLASMAAFYVTQAHASAQTIDALNVSSPVVIDTFPNTSGPAGSTGADGYDFFHANPNNHGNGGAADPTSNLVSLPGYVTNLTFDSSLLQYNANPNLTVGTTTYGGGLFYSPTYGTTPAAPQTFLTFELTSGTPSTFDLGVLRNYGDTSVYTLSLYSGTPSPATLLSSAAISSGSNSSSVNQFFYGKVSGAGAGDFIVISAAPPSGMNQVTIGGITFDTVSAPEPGTVALMLAGLVSLVTIARLRKTRA